ncbi:helix-turn-helix domain-containing protein [Chitinophaga solisilvae]|uniref:helix-turn-helix domain-containing protein n=1 Tax=Chitinophaga solisilvae TaxID=1233460 RepID=UPI0013702398|nr:AraC family transcriptional regulator [Chitinophaga solisilvae]
MNAATPHIQQKQISLSCYTSRVREGEQFIPEHVFSYQLSGSITMHDGVREYTFTEGSCRLTRRNNLMKFVKQPAATAPFLNISVYLDQATLQRFSKTYGFTANPQQEQPPVIPIHATPFVKAYFDSLKPYDELIQEGNEVLLSLKQQEAIGILLQSNATLKDVLFDFAAPGRIDLEAFMQQNFHFNTSLNRFAYLTGRSLSTFKRDFEKTFGMPPGKWLQQRRLQEAYYLIREKGASASDVYIEVGFEDLSHFSFAFKKMYGASPTRI